VLVVGLSACGGSNGTSAADESLLRKADTYEISLIEKDFHEAMTKKDIDQMMNLWAPNATFTYRAGQTATGKAGIRKVWLKSAAWKPDVNWLSDHPAYKLRVTINGDRGTLHFECHFLDIETNKVALVTAADQDVAKIDGRWLITRMVGSTTELST
jgi:ketosteroid isomerase-like protein